jgi:hypothetical protein
MTALLTAFGVVVGGGAEAATTSARVTRWIDGDTVETTRGTVRLIGIDTPERGACGFVAATRHAQAIAPAGSRIQLGNPASVVEHDRYGRNLRYVLTPAGRDLGLAQIRDGARARYDSTDGYQWHRRQARYHRADANNPGYGCSSGGSTTGGTQPPRSDGSCPSSAPIKGNQSSMIYHMPGQAYYDITKAEECFATRAAAEAAGYRPAKI